MHLRTFEVFAYLNSFKFKKERSTMVSEKTRSNEKSISIYLEDLGFKNVNSFKWNKRSIYITTSDYVWLLKLKN